MELVLETGPVTLYKGDCREVMKTLPDNSVDAIVTDPPYELGFMGKGWDSSGIAFDPVVWAQAYRVLKPGGHALVFGGTRTWHRVAVAIEDAGFEIRDSIAWLYGCLSDDTEILTSEGWVRYDRATEGQHALAFDTATGALAWQAIQHVHRYPYAGEMVRLHSEHTDQLLTPNHRVILDEGRPTPHTPYVPSEQDLRRLLADVPGARPLPVGAEADVLAGVRGSADLAAEEGQGQASLGAGRPYGAVRDVRDGDVEAGRLAQADRGGVLLEPMQRRAPGGGVGEALPQGQGGLDRRQPGVLSREDDRAEQPRMEGRRYRVQEARELRRSALRASAGMGATDGPQGRVHHGAPATDGRPLRVPADQAGSHQPREPRPQGQPTGEPDPLALEPGAQALRVGEDGGGRLLPSTGVTADVVDYAGVVWCITVPHGAFIARRKGLIFATGNSGFPKSMDVSKAIDGIGGVAPETREFAEAYARMVRESPFSHADIDRELGVKSSSCYWARTDARRTFPPRRHWERLRDLLTIPETFDAIYDAAERVDRVIGEPGANAVFAPSRRVVDAGTPVTETAKAWHGWGTALKPAFEPVVVARKPLVGTVAANVLAYGTGALHIDACRIATNDALGGGAEKVQSKRAHDGWNRPWMDDAAAQERRAETVRANVQKAEQLGRFPSNVILDESQAAALDEQSGVRTSGLMKARTESQPRPGGTIYGADKGNIVAGDTYADSGGASRFFYVAKAPSHERPEVDGHQHSTVKPLTLMRYLVKLVTPPGGTVLEPFAGSGTTLEAALLEGFSAIGIELDDDGTHIPLIRQRLGKPLTPAMF